MHPRDIPAGAQDMTTSVAPEPQDVIGRLISAWNAADAAAFAQLFTEDATLVIWLGDALTGRSEIQQVHNDLFTTRPSKMRLRTVDTRLVDDNTAIVLSVAGVGNEQQLSYDKFQTSVLVRRDESWMIAAAQVTAMSDRSKQHYQSDPDR
jgi:uncharacterized protein (TIGR02246 family)